jgi:hypothetical protein
MSAEVLRAIHGIEIFPVFSLVVFVVVFSVVLIWSSRLDRRRLDACAQLPLDGVDTREESEREAHSR